MTEEDTWTDEDGEPALRHWLSEEKDHPVFSSGSEGSHDTTCRSSPSDSSNDKESEDEDGEHQQSDEAEESEVVVTNG